MLVSCSNTPPIVRSVVTVKREYVLPPDSLISRCPQVECDFLQKPVANADLADCIAQLLAVIAKCDSDWQTLEQWRDKKKHEQSLHQ
ncbi:Rz1-like lysis system protein LysC [Shewanella acanthi]|uniref:Rz1-like lysis system protein LysC n=1 Tax=Shewanella acanthi TaxID=2864212 RepID=UPI003313C5FA